MIQKLTKVTDGCYRIFLSVHGISCSSEGIFTKDIIKSVFNLSDNDFNKLVR
jgi:hypothetical protein